MIFDEITRTVKQSDPDDWYEVPSVSDWDSFIWTLNISTLSNDRRQEIELLGHHARPRIAPMSALGSPGASRLNPSAPSRGPRSSLTTRQAAVRRCAVERHAHRLLRAGGRRLRPVPAASA